jgi:tRNA-dihydrouridine synthase A
MPIHYSTSAATVGDLFAGGNSKAMQFQRHRFSVAPMMDWTDRHCRYFHRVVTRHTLLYTEMVTSAAIRHGKRERLLGYHPAEHPVALQLGGSDPRELAEAARVGADFGYDEINLNVGCPSDRVQAGRFGACLMAEPELVAACVAAMREAVSVPVTVKCRIGIDDQDSEADFARFIETVAAAGCTVFIVHARKAWLSGLSPRQNRDIPPLDYARIYRLKAARPDLTIALNGGVASLDEACAHLVHVDGVMLGRAAYQSPALLADVDHRLFGAPARRLDVAELIVQMLPYVEAELAKGERLSAITRHMVGLVQSVPGARAFRRHLTEAATRPGAGPEVLMEALTFLQPVESMTTRPLAAE